MDSKKETDYVHSSEESSDEEAVDDVVTKQDQSKPVRSRASVSAEAYGKFNQKGLFVPRVIQKTLEQRQRILERLSKAFMFACLESKEKNVVIDAMDEVKVPKDNWVIRQGEDGDNLYVVDQGTLECYKKFKDNEEPKLVKVYNAGEAFGELALLYNAPRAASIKTITDCVLFALDRETFNNIVKDAEFKRREKFEHILSKIELLETMDPYERSKIADVTVIENYKKGDIIIKQGEVADKFYFIEDGTAVATKILAGKTEPEIVYDYKAGDYFGELALLKNEPRAANVVATSDLILLALDREAFNRVLGPLTDILKRNSQKYEKYI